MIPHPARYNGRHLTRCLLLFFIVCLLGSQLSAQNGVIPLYPGVAPGSETWNWEEGETSNTPVKTKIVYNVSRPALTVFRPDSANGTAVILVPGGGMYIVNIEHEGTRVGMELVKKGVTVFVLKYRTGRLTSSDPWQEMLANLKDTAVNRRKLENVRPLAVNDAIAAIRYVREHAAEYGVHSNKIGVVGFSAGGSLALRLCTADNEIRPDFAGLVYTAYRPRPNDTLPASVSPAFIASAGDDVMLSPSHSISLYQAWIRARVPAELHIYTRGGHGLRGNPVAAGWLNRFMEWMGVIGML